MMEDTQQPPQSEFVRKRTVERDPSLPPHQLPSLADQAPDLHRSPASEKRVKSWTFTVPPASRDLDRDPATFALREIGYEEMMLATKVAKGDKFKTTAELVKIALHQVDGRPVNHAEAEGEFYWSKWSTKVKILAVQGYGAVNSTSDAEDDAFLSSMRPSG